MKMLKFKSIEARNKQTKNKISKNVLTLDYFQIFGQGDFEDI